jgi:hypothetical protein
MRACRIEVISTKEGNQHIHHIRRKDIVSQMMCGLETVIQPQAFCDGSAGILGIPTVMMIYESILVGYYLAIIVMGNCIEEFILFFEVKWTGDKDGFFSILPELVSLADSETGFSPQNDLFKIFLIMCSHNRPYSDCKNNQKNNQNELF